jgi:hypothetical protein
MRKNYYSNVYQMASMLHFVLLLKNRNRLNKCLVLLEEFKKENLPENTCMNSFIVKNLIIDDDFDGFNIFAVGESQILPLIDCFLLMLLFSLI